MQLGLDLNFSYSSELYTTRVQSVFD